MALSVAEGTRQTIGAVGGLLNITTETSPAEMLNLYGAVNIAKDEEKNADARAQDSGNGA